MAGGELRFALRISAAFVAGSALALGLSTPARAGFFEQLFGFGRPVERHAAPPFAYGAYEPPSGLSNDAHVIHRQPESAPYAEQCVRTCDGFHFSVRVHGDVSAAQMCHAFCPGSRTEIFSGNGIKDAVAADGSRYSDLPAAFLYRKQLVAGCTCNGHDHFGLAHIDVKTDPSLRRGDVVATKHGLMAFTGTEDHTADFTPVDSYHGFSRSYRNKLSALKVTPPQLRRPSAATMRLPLADNRHADESRRAQLDK